MNSRLILTLSRSLHSHSFLHHRIPHEPAAFHRHVVANRANVAMTVSFMNKTLTTASKAAAAPEVSSISSTPALFAVDVVKMDRKDLNRLDLSSIPSWARSIVNQERCRRKKQESQSSKLRIESAATPPVVTADVASTTTAPATAGPGTTAAAVTTVECSKKVSVAAATNPVVFKLELQAEKSDLALTELKDLLPKLDHKDLNRIVMKAMPTWARPLINNERCNRKKMQSIVEAAPKSLSTSAKALEAKVATPAIAATARASTITTTSGSSSESGSHGTAGSGKKTQEKEQKKKAEKTEDSRAKTGDGFHLHEHLVEAAAKKEATSLWDCDILYDPTLEESKTLDDDIKLKDRGMFGHFYCTSCRIRGERRKWQSAEIFTQFWFKYTPASVWRPGSKDTLRYQSLVHFQKCGCCEKYTEASLDHKAYVKTAIKAFELWTRRREPEPRVNGSDNEELRGPHDRSRCHGCIEGLHYAEDHGDMLGTPYLMKFRRAK